MNIIIMSLTDIKDYFLAAAKSLLCLLTYILLFVGAIAALLLILPLLGLSNILGPMEDRLDDFIDNQLDVVDEDDDLKIKQ